MRPIRWISGIAHTLRGLVTGVHRRTVHLPQLPFGIAVGAAILLLVMVIEGGPNPDESVTDVDELSFSDPGASVGSEFATTPAALDILEFGFGRVLDHQGVERLSLGAIIRNPHDTVVMPGTLSVVATDEDGAPVTIERIYLDFIPAGSSVPIGYVLLERAEDIDEDTLDLVVEEAQKWDPPEDAESDPDVYPFGEDAFHRPEIEVVGIEPLFSPEGYRIAYQIEMRHETDRLTTVKITIVFRDSDGEIIGGIPGWGDPFGTILGEVGYRAFPPGVSLQHLDLPQEYIPEGADLNKIEIGPGV